MIARDPSPAGDSPILCTPVAHRKWNVNVAVVAVVAILVLSFVSVSQTARDEYLFSHRSCHLLWLRARQKKSDSSAITYLSLSIIVEH